MTIFAPTDCTPDEARQANLPTGGTIVLDRITSAPADFFKAHTHTGELSGLVCRSHQTFDEGCTHCTTAMARRQARRIEQLRKHVARLQRQGRFGR